MRHDARVDNALAACLRADRPHRMRGVAKEGNAFETPARDRIAVAHRIFENLGGTTDQIGKPDPREIPIAELIEKAFLTDLAVPALALRAIASIREQREPVDQRPPVALGLAADRVDDAALVVMPIITWVRPSRNRSASSAPRHSIRPANTGLPSRG